MFLVDSVMLLYSTSNLRKTLQRDFANRLEEEANRLRALFYIFTVCYLFRTVFLCVQGWIPKIVNMIVDDKDKTTFICEMIVVNTFYLWDILPFFMSLWMHHTSFRTVRTQVITQPEEENWTITDGNSDTDHKSASDNSASGCGPLTRPSGQLLMASGSL